MTLEELSCPVCTGNPLTAREDGRYFCPFCGTTFKEKAVKENVDLVAFLTEKLNAQDYKQYCNAKANLWTATHKEFLSNEEIKSWINEVKKYVPDDFFAEFYQAATFDDTDELCEYLISYLKKGDFKFADEVVKYIIKTADSERLVQPLVAILDIANFPSEEYETYKNTLNDLSEKLNEGLFVTAAPRDVFIAYSSKDVAVVSELINYIELNGLTCFCAQRNLRHGKGAKENYAEELKTAMQNCKCVVFVSSENSRRLDCDAVKIEIPYLKSTLPELGRIEYVVDKENYSKAVPLVKEILSDYFKGLEFCTDKTDLTKRIFNAVSGFQKPKVPEVKTTVIEKISNVQNDTNTDSLLKRAFMLIDDGETGKASQLFEQVLNQDPENGKAYLGKLLLEANCKTKKALVSSKVPLRNYKSYKRAFEFADEQTKTALQNYDNAIINRIEEERKRQEKKARRKAEEDARKAEEERKRQEEKAKKKAEEDARKAEEERKNRRLSQKKQMQSWLEEENKSCKKFAYIIEEILCFLLLVAAVCTYARFHVSGTLFPITMGAWMFLAIMLPIFTKIILRKKLAMQIENLDGKYSKLENEDDVAEHSRRGKEFEARQLTKKYRENLPTIIISEAIGCGIIGFFLVFIDGIVFLIFLCFSITLILLTIIIARKKLKRKLKELGEDY